jgi:hypothetical protein
MEQHKPVNDFFLGLVGVAVIGLLTAVMLFALLPMSGQNELAVTQPMGHTQEPVRTN